MNPWEILGTVIGWVLLSALSFAVLVFVIAVLITVVKAFKRPKKRETQIFKSD